MNHRDESSKNFESIKNEYPESYCLDKKSIEKIIFKNCMLES